MRKKQPSRTPVLLGQHDLVKIHAVQLELLQQAIAVCNAENLKWYLVGGGALGAVKYHGFIPWDDDLDLALPRKDYETFLRCAPNYLNQQTFLQHYTTDPEYPLVFAKLRASGTTFIEWSWRNTPMHHGIYLDIFPLDGYPRHWSGALWFQLRFFAIRLLLKSARKRSFDSWSFRRVLERTLHALIGRYFQLSTLLRWEDQLLQRQTTDDSLYYCNFGNKLGRKERVLKSVYGEGKQGTFEGLSVCLPSQIEAFLLQRFGDYHREIPESQRCGTHLVAAADAEKDYSDYL